MILTMKAEETHSSRDEVLEKPSTSSGSHKKPRKAPKKHQIEVGGRDGLDPTRYGDWEKNGRCIDF